jgi:nucleotide-binding universal stress UspA family protein
MKPIKKILLPTDFSDNSWNAIKYALELFKHEACNFFLLNTYMPKIYSVEYVSIDAAKFGVIDGLREVSETKLNEMNTRIVKEFHNPNHLFTQISSLNTLVDELRELQKTEDISYIIMGSKGATGAKEILFGSNTVHVFKHVRCPVLAVPSSFTFETPHDILFPSDYEIAFHDKLVSPIMEIARKHHSRVNFLHVSYGSELSKKQEKNKQKLESYFEKTAYLFHEVSNQNVTGAIADFQSRYRVNLLVMIKSKHSFFENLFFKSITNQIGYHLNIPLLVIPA